MVIGTLIGTVIGIEDRMNQFGEFLKSILSAVVILNLSVDL